MDERLLRLRVELYTAAQSVVGEEAEEFWKLIDEIKSIEAVGLQKRALEKPG